MQVLGAVPTQWILWQRISNEQIVIESLNVVHTAYWHCNVMWSRSDWSIVIWQYNL